MNIENVKELIAFLKTVPASKFDHGSWSGISETKKKFEVHEQNICGTTACIGGWAAIHAKLVPYTVNSKNEVDFENDYIIGEAAQEWLGLTDPEAAILFYPFDLECLNDFEYFGFEHPYPFKTAFEMERFVSTGALQRHTEINHAIAFLEKMVEHERVDILWWAEVKGINYVQS